MCSGYVHWNNFWRAVFQCVSKALKNILPVQPTAIICLSLYTKKLINNGHVSDLTRNFIAVQFNTNKQTKCMIACVQQ